MAKKTEFSVEDKLRALYDLQLIDSRIDRIRSVQGELPLEVEDLEDEVAGLEVRMSKINEELKQCSDDIKAKDLGTEHSKTMIKKYNEQQKNVRNNREFDSLSKEIEYQELEAQLAEKRIKENSARIDGKKEVLDEVKGLLKAKEEALEAKNNELKEIIAHIENQK